MLRRIPFPIRNCLNGQPLIFSPFSFFSSSYFHSSSISLVFPSSFLTFPPKFDRGLNLGKPTTPTAASSSPPSWHLLTAAEGRYSFNNCGNPEGASLLGNAMALRAVRSRQQAAASVGPYVRPAAVTVPSAAGAAKGLRPLTSQASSNSTDTATFPLQKKYGQHLLKNPGILDKLLVAANINSSDVVLEIGPGTGNLTVRLCGLARAVHAMDIDGRMIAEVERRCRSLGLMNLKTIHADVLRQDLGKFDVCAANLPYQISSPFLFKLIAHKHPFRCAVLMFQEEFGERLLAQPGDPKYCRLAANAQLFAKITRVCKVDKNSFRPPPKVNSVIVKIVPKKEILPVDFREWNGLLRICFSRKRKTLRSIFKKPSVLSFLEQNHKICSALTNTTPVGGSSFKELCLGVLEAVKLDEKRSRC